MSDFAVGDRVTLNFCPSWNLPYRKFAKEGRLATIENIRPDLLHDPIKIIFDVKRRGAKPVDAWVSARDLTPALAATPAIKGEE
ncbi:hypothetical protein ACFSTI_25060 [Rhizorhabdus histidinilytica]|uniref:Uncharacterized protein n=1 Tax=Rhizorhabdus histidinilytica TaxID=439228 RepID=A0A1T5A7P6_9SPHN|nr:hypothetical protein [Rhizorhabdus histidinilytica]SKB31052.1 hypothetical protein SAMN06295920_101686 [Rhizorhabdus histidinilytica]